MSVRFASGAPARGPVRVVVPAPGGARAMLTVRSLMFVTLNPVPASSRSSATATGHWPRSAGVRMPCTAS